MRARKIAFAIFMIAIIGITSGCVYSNNKSWDDLSVKEQQEVKQVLVDVREEIKTDFASEIIDKVEEAITKENVKATVKSQHKE